MCRRLTSVMHGLWWSLGYQVLRGQASRLSLWRTPGVAQPEAVGNVVSWRKCFICWWVQMGKRNLCLKFGSRAVRLPPMVVTGIVIYVDFCKLWIMVLLIVSYEALPMNKSLISPTFTETIFFDTSDSARLLKNVCVCVCVCVCEREREREVGGR